MKTKPLFFILSGSIITILVAILPTLTFLNLVGLDKLTTYLAGLGAIALYGFINRDKKATGLFATYILTIILLWPTLLLAPIDQSQTTILKAILILLLTNLTLLGNFWFEKDPENKWGNYSQKLKKITLLLVPFALIPTTVTIISLTAILLGIQKGIYGISLSYEANKSHTSEGTRSQDTP